VFVDDDPKILETIQRYLLVSVSSWSARFFLSAAEALESLAREPAELVVTDLCMSGLDGADLLQIVARQFPQTARVVFSGQAELDYAQRASDVAHQFLAKPATTIALCHALESIAEQYAEIPDANIRQAIAAATVLPVSPVVARELKTLGEKQNLTAKRLASCIERDAALTAKLLQFANSGFFSQPEPTTTVLAAVERLGTTLVRQLFASHEVAGAVSRSVNSLRLQDAQSYALVGARIARRTAPPLVADDAYLVTLLRGLGEMLFPRLAPEIWPTLSAQLIGLWGFPPTIVSAVGGAVGEERGSPAWELARYARAANRLAHGELPVTEINQRFAFIAGQRAGTMTSV
jgi:FixJ family two-component response regulator